MDGYVVLVSFPHSKRHHLEYRGKDSHYANSIAESTVVMMGMCTAQFAHETGEQI